LEIHHTNQKIHLLDVRNDIVAFRIHFASIKLTSRLQQYPHLFKSTTFLHLRAVQGENYHDHLHPPLNVTDSHPFAPSNMATRRGMLDEMDAATAALSLCLELQDIKELVPNFQGNDSSGNTSNEEVAFRSYNSELESRIRAY
jgi:hypothetical protein